MTPLIILGVAVLMPFMAIMALRVHGAIAFMSLCLGSVLVNLVAPDVTDFITGMIAGTTLGVGQWVKLGLLILPFALTILFTRGSVSGGKLLTNFFTALASGLLFALLALPLLDANLQRSLDDNALWQQINSLETAIILGGAFFSLLSLLLFGRPKHHDDGKHGK